MNLQKIIFIIIFFILGLFFILNVTYFNKEIENKNLNIPNVNIGLNEVIKQNGAYKEIKQDKISSSKVFIDNIDEINKVYFSSNNYDKKIESNGININIGEGIYLFDIYDLTRKFSINNETFLVSIKSPGSFVLDTRKSTDIKIFSLSSVLNVTLIGEKKEQMTSLVIYPHIYYGFNSTRNKFLKNADILRIDSVSKIFYVKEQFLDSKDNLNKVFLDKINLNNNLSVNIFDIFFKNTYSKLELDKYDLNNMIIYNNKNLFGASYIEKYTIAFLNKEKKLSFYKKDILYSISDFFNEKLTPKEIENSKNKILNDLDLLKKLDIKEYDKFKKVISFYYKNLLKINDIKFIDNVVIFSKIMSFINDSKEQSIDKSFFYLNKIYTLVDFKKYDKFYLQQNLIIFLNNFLKENNISIDDWNLAINQKDENNIKIDYFTFFLKNILTYDVSFGDINSIDSILDEYKVYLLTSNYLNSIYTNNTKTETTLIEFNIVFEKLLTEIRSNLFKKDLNDNNLLVLNNDISINNAKIEKIKNIYNYIYNFYNKNKTFLSSKNLSYNTLYLRNKNKFLEYHLALDNYREYAYKYNNVKSDLLNTNTVLENSQKVILSKENLFSFISQFVGIDASKITYSISPKNYYKISGLIVNGDTFSFDLYPLEYNRLDNITQNNNKLTLSYELDTLKDDLKTLYEDADDKQKDKYDFKRFFLNTFYSKDDSNTGKIFETGGDNLVEDKVITIFKRDKLLGNTGDFSILKGYLDLKYDDVSVILANNNYNIKINNGVLKTQIIQGDENVNVTAKLRAEYVFSDKNHYFKNIYLKFYDSQLFNKQEELELFSGKEFRIFKTIDVVKFKDEMNKEIQNLFKNN